MTIPRDALRCGRLTLEPIEVGHTEAIFDAVASSVRHLLPWLPWAADISLEEVAELNRRAIDAWAAGRDYDFAISMGGSVVGVATLAVTHGGVGELGYWVRADRAGQGIATEACRAAVRFGFDVLSLYRIEARVGLANSRSLRVVDKVGFVREGTLRNGLDGSEGPFDTYMVGLTPAQWAAIDGGQLPA